MADKTGYIGRNPGDSSVTIARQTFTPTSNTTEFTFTSGYTVGLCDVYLNGVKLVDTRDYEANTGSTVGLTSEAVSGDIVEIIAYKAFNLGNVTSASGNFTVGSNLSVGSTATLSGVTTCEGDLYVGGVIYGDGSNLTGTGDTSNLNTNNIQISGITTLGSIRGDIQIDGSAVGVTSVTWDASADSLIFKDGSYAKFGDSSDLSIYHSGSGSHILDGGSGSLHVEGSGIIFRNAAQDEKLAEMTENASVDLYYNNSKKFNTDSAGSYTTGIHTASQSLHAGTTVQLDGGTGIVTASSIAVGAALAGNNLLQLTGGVDSAFVRLKKSNASGAGVAYGGLNVFDNGNVGIASVVAHNEGSGTAAYLSLYTYNSGAIGERLRVQGDGISVTGISSATGSLHVGTTITADAGTGIVTATSYKGDGSALTGVGGEFDITSCLFI